MNNILIPEMHKPGTALNENRLTNNQNQTQKQEKEERAEELARYQRENLERENLEKMMNQQQELIRKAYDQFINQKYPADSDKVLRPTLTDDDVSKILKSLSDNDSQLNKVLGQLPLPDDLRDSLRKEDYLRKNVLSFNTEQEVEDFLKKFVNDHKSPIVAINLTTNKTIGFHANGTAMSPEEITQYFKQLKEYPQSNNFTHEEPTPSSPTKTQEQQLDLEKSPLRQASITNSSYPPATSPSSTEDEKVTNVNSI